MNIVSREAVRQTIVIPPIAACRILTVIVTVVGPDIDVLLITFPLQGRGSELRVAVLDLAVIVMCVQRLKTNVIIIVLLRVLLCRTG